MARSAPIRTGDGHNKCLLKNAADLLSYKKNYTFATKRYRNDTYHYAIPTTLHSAIDR